MVRSVPSGLSRVFRVARADSRIATATRSSSRFRLCSGSMSSPMILLSGSQLLICWISVDSVSCGGSLPSWRRR